MKGIEGEIAMHRNRFYISRQSTHFQVCVPCAVAIAVIFAGLHGRVLAAEPKSAKSPPPATAPDNAVVYYDRLFKILPATAEDLDKLTDGLPVDRLREVLKPFDAAVPFLRFGAVKPRCEWGADVTQGPELVLPQLNSARVVSDWVHLRSMVLAADGNYAEILEDGEALLVFGRHIGKSPGLVSRLVEAGVLASAKEVIGEHLLKAPPDAVTKLQKRLAQLPQPQNAADVFRGEAESTLAWLKKLEKLDRNAVFGPGGKLSSILAQGMKPTDASWIAVEKLWADAPRRAADLAAFKTAGEAGAAVLSAAHADRPARSDAFFNARGKSVLATLLLAPRIDKFIETIEMSDTNIVLLQAAASVRLKGPTAVNGFKDPVAGKPIEYIAAAEGFELRSVVRWRDGQVGMTVGGERK